MQLRPYQLESVKAILGAFASGIRKTLLVLPTGTGKTICFSAIARDYVAAGGRVLILAHRHELLQQAADKLKKSTGLAASVEKADDTSIDAWEMVTVGSVQTLQNVKRLEAFTPDYFDLIIVDEAHHAVSPSYRRVLDYFEKANILGVTATADRGDKVNLGTFFETIAYEYTLPQAITDGYLVPIQALTCPLKIDLSGVKVQSGDYQAAALGSTLEPYLEQIAIHIKEQCQNRKTVIFLPLIATSQKMRDILNSQGMKAAEINGESIDRAEILDDFHNDKYQILCNSMLLTEGWDEPSVDCIVCLRPTKVRALYAQIVGRGTRLYPGKTSLLLLDFLWQTEKHDLCRPAHLICQNADISARVAEIMAEETKGKAVDIMTLEVNAESTATAEREEALRKILEDQRKKERRLVDPIAFELSINGKCREPEDNAYDLKQFAPPSEAQLTALEKYGIRPSEVKSTAHASKIIDMCKKREIEGLTTARQINILKRQGFRNVENWNRDEANKMIFRIKANNWTAPKGVEPSTYQPRG